MQLNKECRVDIYRELSEYQKQLVDAEYPIVWVAVNKNQDDIFQSYDLNKVIDFSNKNLQVDYITKYVKTSSGCVSF
jgi:predicted glycosyltransferase